MLKITNDDNAKKRVDIYELIVGFKKKYRNVFIYEVDGEIFIYRSLGRKEYRDILSDNRFNDFEKEELICDTCLLYPDPDSFDWDSVDAGIPTELMKAIRKNSYLDDKKSRRSILDFYRSEMYDLDNQITCIINEAFPQFDIEEIDEWDVERSMKYLTRAEWKLANLRGLQFKEADGEFYGEEAEEEIPRQQNYSQEPVTEEIYENIPPEIPPQPPQQTNTNMRGGNKANKLTPDKMKEREEFLRKFPEFAGLQDYGMLGEEGLAQEGVDSDPAALRLGGSW